MDNFSELWADVVRFVGGIGSFLALFFGGVRWTPAPWMRAVGGGLSSLGALASRRPRTSALVVVLLVFGVEGVRQYEHWQKTRPRPVELAVKVTPPPATNFRNNGKPQPARFEFSGSAAPIALVKKPVTTGIELSPKIEGTWTWVDDRHLEFAPRADWPVGQKFTVVFARKGFLAPTARLDRYTWDFASAPFVVDSLAAEFYQDPTDATVKKVVATVDFSHPVDGATLEARVHVTLQAKGEPQGRALSVHVTYDKKRGTAYVHTEPLAIPERDAQVTVLVDKGVRAARGGGAFDERRTAKVEVPGLYSFLSIGNVSATIVDNERFEPDQVLVVETSTGVSEAEIRKNTQAFLLPEHDPAPGDEKAEERADELREKRLHEWPAADLIDEKFATAQPAVKLEPIAGEKEYNTVHSFRFHAPPGRFLYVRVQRGLAAFGGYLLSATADSTVIAPAFPPTLRILGSGALLSMSGQKKVSLYARDVPGVRYEIGRVLPNQIQHLVSQSTGRFERPSLSEWRFGPDNITELFTEDVSVPARPGKGTYLPLDLDKYFRMPGGGERRGLFFLKVSPRDPDTGNVSEGGDGRLVLLTDLGIVVKDGGEAGSGSEQHDVFVQSIHDGLPVAGARVEVIARNGLPVITATTDGEGHARLGAFSGERFVRDRAPMLYLVSKEGDQSFLPLGRYDRTLDTSRFDVGGVREREGSGGLRAYLFSDRGIYRPGEEIHAGLVVKGAGFLQDLAGVPVQTVITDARGATVQTRVVKLDAVGFRELAYATHETSPTGTWTLSAFLMKDGHADALLGSTTVRVREFEPDRMKIRVRLSQAGAKGQGWIPPTDLKGLVTLENLFGTPAEGHRVRGRIVLTPGLPPVGRWKDYAFFDPMRAKEALTDDLPEASTDEHGEAALAFNLSRFAAATYRLHFLAEGFEAEGGRSVSGDAEVTVSPLPWLLGYKADGDLGYVKRGSARAVQVVAIAPGTESIALGEEARLRGVLLQRKYVSVLTRGESGLYKYESVRRELPLGDKPLVIAKDGVRHALDTGKPGDFAWVVKNAADEELLRVEYTVAGEANVSRSLERDAELQIALASPDVEQGGTLEMNVKAPFVGAGLITIERDKVYAWKWFKTTTTASVQTIEVPREIEGNGYVSVTFLRDLASDDVFMSPLSYAVVPFSVSRKSRTAQVTVTAPDLVRPGEPMTMRYRVDRPARIVVFAVDEGLLRVAGYKTPDPLAFFFQKRAHDVRTAQILDLVLPEYDRLMAASAPGGDAEGLLAAHLNPFKRKHDKPAVFWSGILDAGPEEKQVTWQVPDSFNGSVRVMAVAIAAGSIGRFEKSTTVRGDFVISPNVPTFAAPGDAFDVTVAVSNNVVGSGKDAKVQLAITSDEHAEVTTAKQLTLPIGELREGHAAFRVRALDRLGAATLTFTASMPSATAGTSRPTRLATEFSVRPAAPYFVTFQAGHLDAGGSTEAKVPRTLYREFRAQKAGMSAVPLGLAHGLAGYLEKFPHGCTEQVASQAVPAIALGKRPEFHIARDEAERSVARAVEILGGRQNSDGGFGLWAASSHVVEVPSVWAAMVLLEARDRGLEVPAPLWKGALGWLQQLARSPGNSLADERVRAWAVYVLTRSGMVTSALAAAVKKRLETEHEAEWKGDAAAIWLAGTYALLKEDKLSRALLDNASFGAPVATDFQGYYYPLLRDAELLYVIARHFPDRARNVGVAEINALAQPIFNGSYNTLSSAMAIFALEAYAAAWEQAPGSGFAIGEQVGGGWRPLDVPGDVLPWTDFSDGAKALRFQAKGGFPAFWLLSQAGFDTTLPDKPVAERLEVFREITGADGKALAHIRVGDEVQVHVRVRGLKGAVWGIAIVDLLPGGFEVVVRPQDASSDSSPDQPAPGDGDGPGDGEHDGPGDGEGEGEHGAGAAAEVPFALPIAQDGSTLVLEYGDVREDRVVLYASALDEVREFVYAAKATTAGTFAVPPIAAESLYDRSASARGLGGSITVEKSP